MAHGIACLMQSTQYFHGATPARFSIRAALMSGCAYLPGYICRYASHERRYVIIYTRATCLPLATSATFRANRRYLSRARPGAKHLADASLQGNIPRHRRASYRVFSRNAACLPPLLPHAPCAPLRVFPHLDITRGITQRRRPFSRTLRALPARRYACRARYRAACLAPLPSLS